MNELRADATKGNAYSEICPNLKLYKRGLPNIPEPNMAPSPKSARVEEEEKVAAALVHSSGIELPNAIRKPVVYWFISNFFAILFKQAVFLKLKLVRL